MNKNVVQTATQETEGKIQAGMFQFFHNTYPHLRGLLYHVPNGEYRNKVTAALLTAKGVVAGIPDLVFHYRAKTYFFEIKKPGGTVSPSQKKIHKALDEQRFIIWVIETQEEFEALIKNIILDTSSQYTLGISKEDFFYKHKVFSYLYSLADGELVLIQNVCEDSNKRKFVNFVTEFIVEGYARLDGFEILFTPDYLAFYRKNEGTVKEIEYKGRKYV